MNSSSFLRNGAGRLVPRVVNGVKQTPFRTPSGIPPRGRTAGVPIRSCADYPSDGNKVVKSLKEALRRAGLHSGMTISTHHHLRNGDTLTNALFGVVDSMGVRRIRWFPSASFPCHEQLIPYFRSGTIHHCEGSMNGALGRFASDGGMRGTGVLRSHGTRYQAVQDGEVHIDIAVIAAPAADMFGNASGVDGPSACGPLGFALVDSEYADRVIVVTDHLVPFPCVPWSIQGNRVDFVVEVPSLGDPALITSGTTVVTRSPDRQRIASYIVRFAEEAGILKDGFSFQAGAGGTSLAFVEKLKNRLSALGIRAGFVRGGSSGHLVGLLEEGLAGYILDGQAFDQAGVRSLKENPRHVPTSPFTSYNYHGKGNFASMVDLVVLGATEVDLDFNANVVTHSDGYLLHGIGGWQDCLFARCTVLAVPSFRDRIPVIVKRVTTLCAPGEMIDVVVTERGIAVNPRRQDLAGALRSSGLPLRTLEDIRAEVLSICGGEPSPASVDERRPVAVVKWVDGSLLDTVYRVAAIH